MRNSEKNLFHSQSGVVLSSPKKEARRDAGEWAGRVEMRNPTELVKGWVEPAVKPNLLQKGAF